ncbi:MAG: hypothetical protein ACFCVB_07390 [Nodosilinea sp.]
MTVQAAARPALTPARTALTNYHNVRPGRFNPAGLSLSPKTSLPWPSLGFGTGDDA